MAAELEKYLVDKLKEIPKEDPERKFLEDELVRTRLYLMGISSPEEILTEEFAQRVNRVAGLIPDSVELYKLHYRSQRTYGKNNSDVIDHELPPWQFSWRTFRTSLVGREQKEITAIIEGIVFGRMWQISKLDKITLGELREIPLDELLDPDQYSGIGPKRAIFAKVAFARLETKSG